MKLMCNYIAILFSPIVCTLKEGMNTPQLIPTEWINADPSSPTVSNVRPGTDDKWVVPKETAPEIIVQLVETGEEPIPVGEVQINGNVPKFSVYYKITDDADEEFVPVSNTDDEEPQVLLGTSLQR